MAFQYFRPNSTPEKRTQHNLQRVSSPVERKLMSKILNFINRI